MRLTLVAALPEPAAAELAAAWRDTGRARPAGVFGMVRIQAVYTPPEHRRNGYAAGLTWALSQHALANGAERVLLHADLDNPTSNGVYQRIGFRPVHDVTEFEFVD